MKKLFLISTIVISSVSWASSYECTSVAATKRIGTVCKSSRGHQFKRIREQNHLAWQDLTTGMIWYDAYVFRTNHYEAAQYCAGLNLRLPTEMEFDLGLAHDVQEPVEVFRTSIGYRTTYWTSTVKEDNSDFAVIYYESGKKDYSVRENKTAYTRAVCVGK